MHLAAKDLEALLSSVPTPSLQHLLTCARCRRNLTSVLFDLDVPGEELVTADLGEAPIGEARRDDFADPSFRETVLRRALALGESEGQRPPVTPEARLNSRDLLNGPPDLRLEAIATEARFRDLGVAEVLLSEGRTVSTDDPLQSRHLAGLAAAILEGLAPSSRGDRLQAEAAGILGDAERRGGRLDLADDFFKQAAWAMRDQPLILSARAILCRLSAALRQEQGRVDEALGLLEHASTLAEELGDFKELALSRLAYGWLLLDEFDTERAILPLREALSLLDPEHDPYSFFSALHALALAYAEVGDHDQLDGTLSMLDELAPSLSDPLDRVRIRWIGARAAWRLLEFDKAISELEGIFDELAEEGPGPEAALAGLELARMVAERDRDPIVLSQTLRRVSERLEALPPERLAPHLLPILRFALRFPARREGAYLDVLLGATSYVEHARFNPEYPYCPTPHPDLTLVWNDLTGAQRRKAAQTAGVELDRTGNPRSGQDQFLIAWTHEALTGVRLQIPPEAEDDDTRLG